MADSNRTTCIHLAAKNGHTDIIRLLLQAGVDINRKTVQGSSLHEAALYGKIEVVKLLLDCGIDVNQLNSSEQTALDIINKFTTSRAARELKHLLKEASYAVHARAVKEYYNMQDPAHISFREGDYIKVVEKQPTGMWRGYVIAGDGHPSKTGLFPSNHVVLVDAQALANRPISGYSSGSGGEKSPLPVMSPQVPDLIAKQHHCQSNGQTVVDNESMYGHMTVGCDESFPPPPSPLMSPKNQYRDTDRDSGISPQQSYPPQSFPSPQGFPRQNSPHSPAERTAEWIGRYVSVAGSDGRSGSPASSSRGSPSSSNRNSISSTNSGGYVSGHYVNSYQPQHGQALGSSLQPPQPGGPPSSPGVTLTTHHQHSQHSKQTSQQQQHRLSGQSYESGVSGVSSRQSYHSGSSSSLGSLDRLEESGYASTINVHELYHQGLADHEVLRAWLSDLHYEEYYTLFIHAGYDMPTISRMTPEDLTAIGITKPAHRKRLKAEIGKLHINDGIPDFVPHDVIQWLHLLCLGDYKHTLTSQGYSTVDSLTDITWEDLEEIGIKRLGHQKKIMLAIDRLRRIQSGQLKGSAVNHHHPQRQHNSSQELLEPPSSYPTPQWLNTAPHSPNNTIYAESPAVSMATSNQSSVSAPRSPSLDNLMSRSSHQQQEERRGQQEVYSQPQLLPAHQVAIQAGEYAVPRTHTKHSQYQPDVIAIQVNQPGSRHSNASSSESDNEALMSRTHYSFQSPMVATRSRHSSGDVTPTYDRGGLSGDETDGSSGTLKRPSARISPLPKTRPIAKVLANKSTVLQTNEEDLQHYEYQCGDHKAHSPVIDGAALRKNKSSEHIYDSPAHQQPHAYKQQLLNSPMVGTGRASAPSSPYKMSANFFGGSTCEGSPQHQVSKAKKAPPPPPKRTNSIKQNQAPTSVQRLQGGKRNSDSDSVQQQGALTVSIPGSNSQTASQSSPSRRSPGVSTSQHSPHQYSPKPMPLLNTSSYSSAGKSLSEKFRGGSREQMVVGGSPTVQQPSSAPPPLSVKPKLSNQQLQQYSAVSSREDQQLQQYSAVGSRENYHNSHNDNKGCAQQSSAVSETGSVLTDVIDQLEGSVTENSRVKRTTRLGDWQDSHADSSSDSDTDTLKRPHHTVNTDTKPANQTLTSLSSSTSDLRRTNSTSTIDSNTLPFANENVGTIKQRNAANNKPSIVSVSSGEGPDEKSVELNSSMFTAHNTATIQRNNASSVTMEIAGSTAVTSSHSTEAGSSQDGRTVVPSTAQRQASNHGVPKGVQSGDVLNDIGNMLEDLTNELDAMLEFEIPEA